MKHLTLPHVLQRRRSGFMRILTLFVEIRCYGIGAMSLVVRDDEMFRVLSLIRLTSLVFVLAMLGLTAYALAETSGMGGKYVVVEEDGRKGFLEVSKKADGSLSFAASVQFRNGNVCDIDGMAAKADAGWVYVGDESCRLTIRQAGAGRIRLQTNDKAPCEAFCGRNARLHNVEFRKK